MVAAAAAFDSDAINNVELSGPGFLNIAVSDHAVWEQASARLRDPRKCMSGICGPRSSGDCLARVLGFLGADVVRQNHVGDWGTQFGMLIQYLDEHPEATWRHDDVGDDVSAVSALDELYKIARTEFEADSSFADRSRARVVCECKCASHPNAGTMVV